MPLVALLVTLHTSLGGLPPEGYVDVDALLRRNPRWARVSGLRAEARRLRALAEQPAPVDLPAPPAVAASETLTESLDLRATGFEVKAEQVEIDLLREALSDQIEHNRERRLMNRSFDLLGDLLDDRRARREKWREWERAMAVYQQLEGLNIAVRLHQEDLPATEVDRLSRERTVLSTVTQAVASTRRREADREATRYARQRAVELFEELEDAALEEKRQADRMLARRAGELEQEVALREQYRRERLQQVGRLEVELDLEPWRRALKERGEAVEGRRIGQRERYLEAARALEARADEVAAELSDLQRPRILAALYAIEKDDGVVLRTDPAVGLPDVTDAVAQRLARIERGPSPREPTTGPPR